MLRITVVTSPDSLTFLVEGKLVGGWAQELERSWQQAALCGEGRSRIVDLTETMFIDGEGRRVLMKLHEEGARFRARCPMIQSIIDEIVADRNRRNPSRTLVNQTDSRPMRPSNAGK
jgi:hypothetical protein